jgi:hypothetical protein
MHSMALDHLALGGKRIATPPFPTSRLLLAAPWRRPRDRRSIVRRASTAVAPKSSSSMMKAELIPLQASSRKLNENH